MLGLEKNLLNIKKSIIYIIFKKSIVGTKE